MAGVAPAVKIICDGLKDTDLSMTWDMNPATAFVIRKISVKGERPKTIKTGRQIMFTFKETTSTVHRIETWNIGCTASRVYIHEKWRLNKDNEYIRSDAKNNEKPGLI